MWNRARYYYSGKYDNIRRSAQGDEIKTVHDAIDIYFILENIKTWIRIIHNFDLEGCINAVLKLKY